MTAPGGPGDAPVNERPTFTRCPGGKVTSVTTATSRRRPLLVLAAVGVVAGTIGIGASIAGVDDDRAAGPPLATTTTTTTPSPAVGREEAERIALDRVAGTVDRARISEEEGGVAWEVRVDTEHGHTDVLVDATTGEVLDIDD